MIYPSLNYDRSHRMDDYNGVVVHRSHSIHQCILEKHAVRSLKLSTVHTHPTMPCLEVIPIGSISLHYVRLTTVCGDKNEYYFLPGCCECRSLQIIVVKRRENLCAVNP
jgi:hypothetical protein